MAIAKIDIFHTTDQELADIAKAMAHPARVQILRVLNDKDQCIVGDLVDLLPLSQSTVSQHLKELKRVGLIRGEIDGPRTCYCLNERVMEKAKTAFTSLFSSMKCC
ncbi:MAG: metalloregulator ArsR/SmtB family transcription factor [Candidatus Marinimicrobia bacterium]|nr:metalloregulator ArsR/SmtB family transcription factor [Candidatus Neomarinimicrobiota bacterium]MCF7904510.1 metalloregulator ArsR/SmtB family transcription factor [Candidatus Neomarinimicrobiota bacterium]